MATGRSSGLTSREQEILDLVGQGATNREIAVRLWLSVHTVDKHVRNSMEKLGAHTRAEAVWRSLKGGHLDAE